MEGPKKIEQVHADARREESNRARAAAGGGPNRGSRGGDYGRSSGLDAYGGPPQRYIVAYVIHNSEYVSVVAIVDIAV